MLNSTVGPYLNKEGKLCILKNGKEREIASIEIVGEIEKPDGTIIPIKTREVKE
jgi:hypothetical protein